MIALIVVAAALSTQPADARLQLAVRQAIQNETNFGIGATKEKDIDRYMETVPADYRILEDDGSVTDRDTLRAKQLQAWSIITRTNALDIDVTNVEVGCEGHCAVAFTHQRWDRQMLGKDGVTEFNVVTTQRHRETWEERDSRWIQTEIVELGGTTTVDGKPY